MDYGFKNMRKFKKPLQLKPLLYFYEVYIYVRLSV